MKDDLIRQVGEILHGYNMLRSGDGIGVAVSGGADSVVLLHVLMALTRDTGHTLAVLHFNHKQRGQESEGDEGFVRALAAEFGLAFYLGTVPLQSHANLRSLGTVPALGGNLEQELRRHRQRFYQFCRTEYSLARIALGHTKSDQAETVMFRILRGTGRAGLAGMAPVNANGLIRPLLFQSRSTIRAYAEQAGLTWREDRTNQDVRFRRNYLRLITLPDLQREFNPNLETVLARVAGQARDEEDWLNCRTKSLYRKLVRRDRMGLILSATELVKAHVALQRRVLRLAVQKVKGSLRSIDAAHIEAIRNICMSRDSHDRVMIPGVDAVRSYETLLLAVPFSYNSERNFEQSVTLGRPVALPLRTSTLCVEALPQKEQNCVTVKGNDQKIRENILDRDTLEELAEGRALRVRNWEPGDQLQVAGTSRPVKIKTLFQGTRVLLWERRSWPVLVAGDQIVWAHQFGVDGRFAATSNTVNQLQVVVLEADYDGQVRK